MLSGYRSQQDVGQAHKQHAQARSANCNTRISCSYATGITTIEKDSAARGQAWKSLAGGSWCENSGDLLPFSQLKLQELYGVNAGTWLWNMARGKNGDEVQGHVLTESHSCSRAFPGPKALTSMTSVMHWLRELGDRLQEQLNLDLKLYNRTAKLLVFHATVHLRGRSHPAKKFPSKSCPLRYGKEKILADTRMLFERGLREKLAHQITL